MGISCGTRNIISMLIPLLLLSISRLSSSFSPSDKVTEPLLEKICSEPSIQRTFCIRHLRSNPKTFNVDLHGLLGLTIETAEAYGVSNRALMSSLAKKSTDPEMKPHYQSCSKIYNSAISQMEKAKGGLRARAYPQIYNNMANAFDLAGSCEDEFEGPSTEPPVVLRRNEVFERFCNIARVISALLGGTTEPPSFVL